MATKKKDSRLARAGVSGYNKPKRTPNHPKKSHIVVAKEGDKTKSALAAEVAAELYGLDILQRDMQDADDNTTLFVAISKEPVDVENAENKVLTSLIFTTRNIAAGLYKAMGGFATNGVNIIKLESYIPDYTKGTAQFFVSFEGDPQEKNVQSALDELGYYTTQVTPLGTYESDPVRYGK